MDAQEPAQLVVALDKVKFTVSEANLTGFRPQTEGPGYGAPFARTAVPAGNEDNPGVGIRRNGDDDNANSVADMTETNVTGENDLIEIDVLMPPAATPGTAYVLSRSNTNINVWNDSTKAQDLLTTGTQVNLASGGPAWVEWATMAPSQTGADLELSVWDTLHNRKIGSDTLHFYPFRSVVIVLGGEGQDPGDPVPPQHVGNYGMFEQIAIPEYRNGYDVHMYNEDAVDWFDGEGLAYDEVVSAIQGRGVTQVAIMGYSHGGGATYQLAERLHRNTVPGDLTDITNPFTVPFTAYVDAITSYTAGAENRRPLLAVFHCNQYQQNTGFPTFLNGGPSGGDDDIDRSYRGVVHTTIDDDPVVLELVRIRFEQRIPR